MRVKLLWFTPRPEIMVALAMRRCYSSKPIEDLEKEILSKPGYEKELITKALRDKTFDVIEHAVFMFEIEGVSRVTCYSEDTEVLTNKGWKFFRDLDGKETFATLNPSTFAIEYTQATDFVVAQHTGPMMHFKSSMIDLLVTPNHRMFFFDYDKRSNQTRKWKIASAGNLIGKRIRLKTDGIWKAPDIGRMAIPSVTLALVRADYGSFEREYAELSMPFDSYARFLGFFAAEGALNHSQNGSYRIGLYQSSKSAYFSEMLNSIFEIGFRPNVYKLNGDEHLIAFQNMQFYHHLKPMGSNCFTKTVPLEIKNASARQIRLYLDSYVKGDGSIYRGQRVICTSSLQMANDLQELALKAGFSALIRKDSRVGLKHFNAKIGHMIGQTRPSYVVSFRQYASLCPMINQQISTERNQISQENYEGRVFCVSAPPNELLYVRRNGRPVWSGNTHQLVRHRIASYDQESQRFSAVEKEDFIVPHTIQSNPAALKVYEDLLRASIETFKKLKELEVPKEDARFVLPQSIGTKIVMTANARALMHFFYQRTALQAQWEIRELAELMYQECKKVAPTIFSQVIES